MYRLSFRALCLGRCQSSEYKVFTCFSFFCPIFANQWHQCQSSMHNNYTVATQYLHVCKFNTSITQLLKETCIVPCKLSWSGWSCIFNSYFLRPTAEEVLCHCLFWSEKKQLAFFQDVSDRIEKEHVMSPVCQALELNASSVCGGDWRNIISDELKDGQWPL